MTAAIATEEVALETRRLSLTPLQPAHASALLRLQNDWEIVRMLANVPWPLTMADVEAFAVKPLDADRESDDFIILLERIPIGVCGVKRQGQGDPPRAMPRLGYWLGRAFWGRGYATEALAALVAWTFRETAADRIGAGTFSDNLASRRVLEKLGFAEAGRYETRCLSRQQIVPTTDMQVARACWAGMLHV